jgi:hypothetical protein
MEWVASEEVWYFQQLMNDGCIEWQTLRRASNIV